jgi:hypothetical protein
VTFRVRWTHLALSLHLPALLLLAAPGCKVDADAFQSRVFACDTASAHPLCGVDQEGQDMTCFAAGQLGGTDFCTKSCGDTPMTLMGEDAVCVSGNAKLQACQPSAGDDACGRPEFGCLRTDVTTDEGVCVTMKPCQEDTDCHDPVRSTCASTFFHKLYAQNTKINTDHLYCLQEGCQHDRTACSPGETCLKDVIPAGAHPPDICVPKCNSRLQCPPNFLCLKDPKISGPGNPGVCVPGLLGFKCQTDVDCLVGRCLPDGGDKVIAKSPGLNLCTVECDNDADCAAFDSEQGLFFCDTASRRCVTPQAYIGASCNTQADCARDPETTVCTYAFAGPGEQGTCLHPCGADGACPALGGVPHTCIGKSATVPGVCFPGVFGAPCASDASCTPGLTCRDLGPAKVCTTLCQKDGDCEANRWTAGQGFCGGAVCLPFNFLPDGAPCARAEQCKANKCEPPPAMSDGPPTCGGK